MFCFLNVGHVVPSREFFLCLFFYVNKHVNGYCATSNLGYRMVLRVTFNKFGLLVIRLPFQRHLELHHGQTMITC